MSSPKDNSPSLNIPLLKGVDNNIQERSISNQNFADRSPHPVIKFFFFDHPPVDEIIKTIERLNP